MIISHRHRFIYVKIEKTAGTSIEIALSKFCGPQDIITPISRKDEQVRTELGYPGPQHTRVPLSRYNLIDWLWFFFKFRRVRFYNHTSAKEARRWIGKKTWDSYYKFTFERNPFDKMVSHYYWRKADQRHGSIARFVTTRAARRVIGINYYGINGQVAVDDVYRFERMEEDLQVLSKKLQLPETITLPSHKAKGNVRKDKRHYGEILTSEETRMIQHMFREQLARMRYE